MVKKIFFILLFLLCVAQALAYPPFPTEFYGTVTSYNLPVNYSSWVYAYDSSDNLCGTFRITTDGYYGSLSCMGDDFSTIADEGAITDEIITFYIDGREASALGDGSWDSREFKRVDLVVPVLICGDSFCDLLEDCSSCELDCGSCDDTNPPGGSGGGTGSGGSGGSGGGSTSSSGGGGAYGGAGGGDFSGGYPTAGVVFDGVGILAVQCTENWVCGNWSVCPSTEIQTRDCTDISICGTYRNKPAEKKACVYDGEKIDVPSPVEEKPGKPRLQQALEISLPEIVCEQETNPLKNGGIWFFLLIVAIIAVRIYSLEKQLETVKHKKNLDDVKRAKLLFAIKRKAYMFIGVMVFFAIVIYLFYVFFFLCQINFTALWILIFGTIILPIIINQFIRFFEYHEQEKIIMLEESADIHYQEIKKLVVIENGIIADIESELALMFEDLSSEDDFKSLLNTFSEVKKIYGEITKLYDSYKHNSVSEKKEALLVNDIFELANEDNFSYVVEKSPKLKLFYDKLLLLYKHYEEKQGLYNELAKAEKDLKK